MRNCRKTWFDGTNLPPGSNYVHLMTPVLMFSVRLLDWKCSRRLSCANSSPMSVLNDNNRFKTAATQTKHWTKLKLERQNGMQMFYATCTPWPPFCVVQSLNHTHPHPLTHTEQSFWITTTVLSHLSDSTAKPWQTACTVFWMAACTSCTEQTLLSSQRS